MAADPVSRPGQLQMRDIAFDAGILHLEELKKNDTSFNRTAVACFINLGESQNSLAAVVAFPLFAGFPINDAKYADSIG